MRAESRSQWLEFSKWKGVGKIKEADKPSHRLASQHKEEYGMLPGDFMQGATSLLWYCRGAEVKVGGQLRLLYLIKQG